MKNNPEITAPGRTVESGANGVVTPEIAPPKSDNATNIIPDEVPRRDGPGGEPGAIRL